MLCRGVKRRMCLWKLKLLVDWMLLRGEIREGWKIICLKNFCYKEVIGYFDKSSFSGVMGRR